MLLLFIVQINMATFLFLPFKNTFSLRNVDILEIDYINSYLQMLSTFRTGISASMFLNSKTQHY